MFIRPVIMGLPKMTLTQPSVRNRCARRDQARSDRRDCSQQKLQTSAREGKRPCDRKNRSWKATHIRLLRLKPSTNSKSLKSRFQHSRKDRSDIRNSPKAKMPDPRSAEGWCQRLICARSVLSDVHICSFGPFRPRTCCELLDSGFSDCLNSDPLCVRDVLLLRCRRT